MAPSSILLDELLIGQDAGNAAFLLDLLRERVEQGDVVIMVNHAPEVTRSLRQPADLLGRRPGRRRRAARACL